LTVVVAGRWWWWLDGGGGYGVFMTIERKGRERGLEREKTEKVGY
jgi:hypothetical protein